MIVRVPKRRNFVKEIIEDLPMINNKEDDHVMEKSEGDALIRVELTNELRSDIGDTRDTKSQCVNNADNHKRYDTQQTNILIHFTQTYFLIDNFIISVSPGQVFQWPAQAPLLQSLQSRQQGGLTSNTLERLRELGIYREREEEAMENLQGGDKVLSQASFIPSSSV